MCRVEAFDDEVSEPKTSDDQNILLLHGTEVPNVEGVLKEGLKPSKTEMFCLVVYPTNSIKTASEYCEWLVDDVGVIKSIIYLLMD